jgi:ribosomal 50S subunit-associated protein YjgA (DUF615 family)
MFGIKLVQQSTLEALRNELHERVTEHSKYVTFLENEVNYYRDKFDAERARADRANDTLLQALGQLPTTDTVISEQEIRTTKFEKARKTQEEQMAEIFGETLESVEQQQANVNALFPPEAIEEFKEKVGEKAMK